MSQSLKYTTESKISLWINIKGHDSHNLANLGCLLTACVSLNFSTELLSQYRRSDSSHGEKDAEKTIDHGFKASFDKYHVTAQYLVIFFNKECSM